MGQGTPPLRRIRDEAGLTQMELWAELDRRYGKGAPSRNTIVNYETGKTSPRLVDAEPIADFLGISLDQLAGRLPMSDEEIAAAAVRIARRGP